MAETTTAVLRDVADLEQALGLRYRLGEEQQAIVTAPLDSALVVAGAGSGKTETMSLRVAWLVGTGQVRPDEVLGLTFTRKAAAELAERVTGAVERIAALAGPGRGSVLVDRPTARTYHSFAADLVSRNAGRLHLDEVRLMGEAACHQLVDTVVTGWREPLDIGLNARQVAAAVLALSAQCAEHRVAPARLGQVLDRHVGELEDHRAHARMTTKEEGAVLESLQRRRALVPLLEAYARRKRDAGLLDHGDQVLLAVEAAELPGVAAELMAEHRVVFLDEYQDTSAVQTDLLATLFGGGHPVTAVGDPHQSIFGWRGASSGTLARFLEHFRTGDGGTPLVHPLSTSWRNPAAVLDLANRVAEPLRRPNGSGGPGLAVGTLRPAPTARPGHVRLAYAETVEQESAQAAGWLAERRLLTVDGRLPTQAVLCRRRSQMARIEDACRAQGLPVVVLGLGGLLDEPEVGDLVAAMTAAHDPRRGDAVLRLLTGPRYALGPADLDALAERARELAGDDRDEMSLVDAVDLPPPPGWVSRRGTGLSDAGRERVRALGAVLARVRQVLHRPVVDVVLTTVSTLALDVEVDAVAEDPRQARRVLDRFVSEAAGYVDVDGTASLAGFLTWLDAARVDERGLEVVEVSPDATAVQIITVHSAKGLEWDDVAVVDAVEGGFPARTATSTGPWGWLKSDAELPYPARGDHESMPVWTQAAAVSKADFKARLAQFRAGVGEHAQLEERRLAYVALTRPKRSLLVSGARWGDGSTPREPSRYLLEARELGLPEIDWHVPDPDVSPEVNPRELGAAAVPWPVPAEGLRTRLRAAADLVDGARQRLHDGVAAPVTDEPSEDPVVQEWQRVVTGLLEQRRDLVQGFRLPAHLSASDVVALADDPAGAMQDLRRPVPRRPYAQARRGSRFHEWVEARSGPYRGLFDPEELVGAADDDLVDDSELDGLKARFSASEWADADLVGVEVPFTTPLDLGGRRVVLRGRIDAVARGTGVPGTVLEVVDWKTGRPPTAAARRARETQLAVYRLAAARMYELPVELVGAAFWYGATGRTVRPADLPDEAGLARLLLGAESD